MRACPECKSPLADNAINCPSCGYVTWWGRLRVLGSVRWWLGTLLIFMLAYCATGMDR